MNVLDERKTLCDVAPSVGKVFSSVASINKRESGFWPHDIFQLESNVFSEQDIVVTAILQTKSIIAQE